MRRFLLAITLVPSLAWLPADSPPQGSIRIVLDDDAFPVPLSYQSVRWVVEECGPFPPEAVPVQLLIDALDYDVDAGLAAEAARLPWGEWVVWVGVRLPDDRPPQHLVAVMDTSGSMEGPLPEARKGLHALIDQLRPADTLAVVRFDSDVVLVHPPSGDADALHDAADTVDGSGGSEMVEALDLAARVALATHVDGETDRIVLFTDTDYATGPGIPAVVGAESWGGVPLDIAATPNSWIVWRAAEYERWLRATLAAGPDVPVAVEVDGRPWGDAGSFPIRVGESRSRLFTPAGRPPATVRVEVGGQVHEVAVRVASFADASHDLRRAVFAGSFARALASDPALAGVDVPALLLGAQRADYADTELLALATPRTCALRRSFVFGDAGHTAHRVEPALRACWSDGLVRGAPTVGRELEVRFRLDDHGAAHAIEVLTSSGDVELDRCAARALGSDAVTERGPAFVQSWIRFGR